MRYWRGYLVAAILCAITTGFTLLAKRFSILIDAFYPYLTREIQTTLAAWSSGTDVVIWQLLAMLLILALLMSIVLMVALKWNVFQWLGWVLAGVSLVWMMHTGLYGLNYYAGPLAEDLHLETADFTVQDLEDATIYFRDKANELALKMPRDSRSDLIYSDFDTLAAQAGSGFDTLTYQEFGPVFAGSLEPVKKLAWADMYTSMGILGVTMPLTGEACVNPQIPAIALPFTMCHEMAHRMCIATEGDANFAAFLACLYNESAEFQYSAYYMAYRYCYSALLASGEPEAAAAAARIDLEVNSYLRYDMKSYDRFFNGKRSGFATRLAEFFNNAYIKLSGDKAGTNSYNRVTISLVNWYIDEFVLPFVSDKDDTGFDPLDKDYINGIMGGG